jgi:hypothetical protein
MGANAMIDPMKIKGVIYHVRSLWAPDNEGPAEIGGRYLEFLDRLGPLDPAMANWQFLDWVDLDYIPLANVAPRIAYFTERNVSRDEGGTPDARDGYGLFALGAKVETKFGSSQTVGITIIAGSDWNNDISFEVGSVQNPPDLALVTYPIYKGALEAMIQAFACPFAWAKFFVIKEYDRPPPRPPGEPLVVRPPTQPRSILRPFEGAWIGYLSAPLAAGLAPPKELHPERTPGGGLILSAVQERCDPLNPEHVRRSNLLEAVMTKRAAKPNQLGDLLFARYPLRVGPY